MEDKLCKYYNKWNALRQYKEAFENVQKRSMLGIDKKKTALVYWGIILI